MHQQLVRVLISAAVLAALAPPADAATICVELTGAGGCQTTITAAIAAAAAGDQIVITPGTYREAVAIPAGLTGLRLSGTRANAVILDAAGFVVAGISVGSPDVTIERLTVRNADSHGIEIGAGIRGTVIQRTSVRGVGGACIRVNDGGGAAVVAKNHLVGCRSDAIDASPTVGAVDDLNVRGNEILRSRGGVSITGNNARVEANTLAVVRGQAVRITGNLAVVLKNSVDVASGGIRVEGQNPLVVTNSLSAIGDEGGFFVKCTNCSGGGVYRNQVSNGAGAAIAFEIYTDTPGFTVERNRASGFLEHGFWIAGEQMRVARNEAADGGTNSATDCFSIAGSGHTIQGNLATGCFGAGFVITDNGHAVSENRAIDNYGEGFYVYSAATVALSNNQALGNTGQGFNVESSTTAITLTGNVATGNRAPFCDDSTAAIDGGGNSFSFPGPACLVS